eukprot:11649822-Alexandrium_andersonii.AAC.1
MPSHFRPHLGRGCGGHREPGKGVGTRPSCPLANCRQLAPWPLLVACCWRCAWPLQPAQMQHNQALLGALVAWVPALPLWTATR